jgi:hypothetical protein
MDQFIDSSDCPQESLEADERQIYAKTSIPFRSTHTLTSTDSSYCGGQTRPTNVESKIVRNILLFQCER